MGSTGNSKITQLTIAAAQGDQAAIEELIRATQHAVRRFFIRLVGPVEADDLTQETYVRALSSVHRFAGRGTGYAWLLSIARRVAIDSWRAAAVRPRTTCCDDWQTRIELDFPHNLPEIGDIVSINLAMQKLSPERRKAFVLTQLLGFDYADTAEICGCPIGTVRSRVARARQDLIAMLGECQRSLSANQDRPSNGLKR